MTDVEATIEWAKNAERQAARRGLTKLRKGAVFQNTETALAAYFGDGNDTWEDVEEEDPNIHEMQWAADDCEDVGPANMPTKDDAEKAFSLLNTDVMGELHQKPMSLEYWRKYRRHPVSYCNHKCSNYN